MVAARLLGYERAEAARFSFLLSIPAISAAGLYKGYEVVREGDAEMIHAAVLAAGFSAIAGFIAIAVLMAWLRRATFKPFVVYRSEEHTSELQSLMRISYAVFCLKKKKTTTKLHKL